MKTYTLPYHEAVRHKPIHPTRTAMLRVLTTNTNTRTEGVRIDGCGMDMTFALLDSVFRCVTVLAKDDATLQGLVDKTIGTDWQKRITRTVI